MDSNAAIEQFVDEIGTVCSGTGEAVKLVTISISPACSRERDVVVMRLIYDKNLPIVIT